MIHVLTLTWNGEDKLKKLAPTLIKNLSNFTHQWHIKDNGSNDNTVKEMKDYAAIYEIGHNRDSFAKGMNYLFDKAEPADDDLILLLNNDLFFGNDNSLLEMVCLLNRPEIGAVGARLLYNDSDLLQHAGVIFGPRYNNLPYHYRHKEKSDANAEKNRYFQAVTAACCIVRAKEWRKVSGFDETFLWAFDDINLMLAIKSTGKKIAYCGQTKIYHEESASLKKNPVHQMFMAQNVQNFRKKWDGKYMIDHDLYLKNPNYNIIK